MLARDAQRHRLPRGAGRRRRRIRTWTACASARVRLLKPCRRPPEPADRRRMRITPVGVARRTRRPSPHWQVRLSSSPLAGDALTVVVRTTPRRLLDLQAAAGRAGGAGSAAAGASTRARRGRLLASRSTAPATSTAAGLRRCPPAEAAEPAHRLPGQGLRQLPAADARPPRRHRAGLAGAQPGRPRRHAGRAARLRRRPAQLPPGRDRAPRPTSARRACGSRSAATPAWWTTSCTTARTPAPGWRSRQRADADG